ncbi:hypothetical protein E4T56_gene7190 [Termitomyces sp. T112]|nr:hypothetical protein E4T56_gene7190 [Termitomyces sp. T112]
MVHPGGGMVRKTVEESRTTHLAHFRSKERGGKRTSSKVTVTPSGRSPFTLEGDLYLIATYMAARKGKNPLTSKAEFAGLASDTLPEAGSIEDIEVLEFDTLIAVEEELRAGIHWDRCTNRNQSDETALSSSTIPLETLSFYLDLGATVHISPDPSNFISLTPISEHPICEVRGSTIATMGVSKIQLHIRDGSSLELDYALLVPKSTVQLLSVSKLTKQADIEITFNNISARLTKMSTNTVIASGTLLPDKNLYALNLHLNHAYAVHTTPDIKTWHNRLGHVNYQAIMQMARAGMIEDEDSVNIEAVHDPKQVQPPTDQCEPPPELRRSGQTKVPTEKVTIDDQPEMHLERAVKESQQSAERVKEMRTDRCRALEELQWLTPEVNDTDVGTKEQDRILAALNTIEVAVPDSDPELDPDMPKSLDKAQKSTDWPQWERSYQDELDSLKDMGIWELVPRENVPQGHKIFKG